MKFFQFSLCAALIYCLPVFAQDDTTKKESISSEPLSGVIDVTDEAALKAAVGKIVTISGKVRHSDSSPQTANVRIWFSDSGFRLFIKADVFDSKEDWGIDEMIGEKIYANGKILQSDAFLQINLTDPNQMGNSVDKLVKVSPDPSKPGPDGEEKYEPVSPGAILPVKPGSEDLRPLSSVAKVKVILAMSTGPVPTMGVSEVKAEIIDAEESGPMQATFELIPALTNKPMIAVMTYLPKKYYSEGWPHNKTVHFVVDEIFADSAPPNFAAAFLIECLLQGITVPDNLVLFGGMSATGKVNFSSDKKRSDATIGEAIKLAAKAAQNLKSTSEAAKPQTNFATPSALRPKGPPVQRSIFLLTSEVPESVLDDFILDEDWNTVNSTQVISCVALNDAVNLAREISEGSGVGKSMIALSAAQKALRERSVRILSNNQVWTRVVAAGRASKNNKTAYAYARMRTKKVSKTYSLDRCLAHVHKQILTASGNSLDKFTDRELRKYVRDLSNEMEKVEPKIHLQAAPVLVTAQLYLKEIAQRSAAKKNYTPKKVKPAKKGEEGKEAKQEKPKEVPDRVEEEFQKAKKAYEAARAEALKNL